MKTLLTYIIMLMAAASAVIQNVPQAVQNAFGPAQHTGSRD